MTYVTQWLSWLGDAKKPHFIGNFLVGFLLTLEESELTFLAGCRRGIWIFYDTGNGGITHDKTTRAATLKLVGQQAEGVGITLKVGDVIPESG